MRLAADACVAAPLVDALRQAGYDVSYAAEGPPGLADTDILDAAVPDDRVLLTEDHDFGALAVRDVRPAVGLVLIELHGFSTPAKIARVLAVLRVEEDNLRGQFTVVEPARTRVRRL